MKNSMRVTTLLFLMYFNQALSETIINLDCGKHNGFESEAIFDSDQLDVTLNFNDKIPDENIQMLLIEECLYIASKKLNTDDNIYSKVTLDGEIETFSPSKFIAPTVSYNNFIYFDYKTKKVKIEPKTFGP